MNNWYIDEPMIEVYVYETSQIVETLEQLMITSEKSGEFSQECINEIFRSMHTVKGSSAMMMFNDMSLLAHHMEDIFFVIRENPQVKYDFTLLVDIILESIDFFKIELMKISEGETPDGDNLELIEKVSQYLERVKKENHIEEKNSNGNKKTIDEKQKYYIRQSSKEENVKYYKAKIHFKKDCEMENIRSYTVVHNIVDLVEEVHYKPNDIIENEQSAEEIRSKGFLLAIKSKSESKKIKEYLESTIFLENLEFDEINDSDYKELSKLYEDKDISEEIKIPETSKKYVEKKSKKEEVSLSTKQNIISVNVDKLDKLMDMVGELVIAQAMVTQNPEVTSLEIESFHKASRQLHKISGELQDLVMAIRMVPLSTTFMKMHRIVRDMTRKLGKNVELDVYGEETEVDKNIIEKIADPLMHIIRNAIDHGIEDEQTRVENGKNRQGTIVLEAKNSGSDVLIIIKDDGKGLHKKALYEKADSNGLVNRPFEEMSNREIYNLILHPGFSTKQKVTEFSGRGVGMDVVTKNIESIGGSVIVDSELGHGTTIILKIPLTIAIIEGMNIKVGETRFTIPIMTIEESFRPENNEIICDTQGQEMIMVRGRCYPILRLHDFYKIPTEIKDFNDGILIMVQDGECNFCIFADELLGQQQVVVKSLPNYIKKYRKIKGLGGCTLLGDGSISLILDVGELYL
ncbi:MAG: chemotaxis protein CheA [Anaeromicrobium sp.]|jgi:two-component system chemotaxis sensor kinase CheA|uniref:chemotaxis protein CheA n=1 Tax=Anaeromicrobium sp. TaxID=1929132 RepID=UPI0025F08046|nr:chemotaxis protein CheA [Anaeromicrobium sp.]MCT4593674.1 chemotaxis protein CheA [Anaeromicrobium sp.]